MMTSVDQWKLKEWFGQSKNATLSIKEDSTNQIIIATPPTSINKIVSQGRSGRGKFSSNRSNKVLPNETLTPCLQIKSEIKVKSHQIQIQVKLETPLNQVKSNLRSSSKSLGPKFKSK